ncbi:toll/interleukin-1 receptor domain-containing protein [Xanthomonas sp. BRIP62409]|uniref:toll/interleukin-1 receptor domain-containing protein n=1 Tax=Xanthomonas sp. BRIP62409 TaxID=2182388 RepID=UPI000F8D8A56|nr:toll/interleukin-1 receptor domain-containing protein [Xanthomonas sp. BRIP62409]
MFFDLSIKSFDSKKLDISDDRVAKFEGNKKHLLSDLEAYLLNEDGYLDADKIRGHLFPCVQVDVFLSHSHGDRHDVMRLAAALEDIGISVFVDSFVWGYAGELLEAVDKKYCYNEKKEIYDYRERNLTTANVYMILNSSLHRMINNSELFIFLETDNSVTIKDHIKNKAYVQSPWIYSELEFSKLIYEKNKSVRGFSIGLEALAEDASARFAYEVPKATKKMTGDDLSVWINACKSKGLTRADDCLNELYRQLKLVKKNL